MAISPTSAQKAAYTALKNNNRLTDVIKVTITSSEVFVYRKGETIGIHSSGIVTTHLNH